MPTIWTEIASGKLHRLAERIRPEVNGTVNYPLKAAMNRVIVDTDLDEDDAVMKFSFSYLLMQCSISWTRGIIIVFLDPDGCLPAENMALTNRTGDIPNVLVSSVAHAVQEEKQ